MSTATETSMELKPFLRQRLQPDVDLLIMGASELCPVSAPAITDGAVAAHRGRIVAVGTTDEVLAQVPVGPGTHIIDATGMTVIPGLVDPHTHLVFAGSREDEFVQRLQGATYQEIMAAGGGIMSTVHATRAASPEELVRLGEKRLRAMLRTGTTTVEIKTGYGLSVAGETKQLHAARALALIHDCAVTFMGAHALPPGVPRDEYVDLVIEEMLPRAKGAQFCDVFCEQGAFTVEESRRILLAGRERGLLPKVHADELTAGGGAELAAAVGAISADHLLYASEDGLRAMAKAGVIAVLLPGTAFNLGLPFANARRMIDLGVTVALATDFNPGSCPSSNLLFMISLACLKMQMTPAEALRAATLDAARAIGMAAEVGSLETGKRADIVVLDAPNHRHIPYRLGDNLVHAVVKRGRAVIEGGSK